MSFPLFYIHRSHFILAIVTIDQLDKCLREKKLKLIGFLFLPGISLKLYWCTAGGWRGTGREGRRDAVFTAWENRLAQVPASTGKTAR
jgi:hypothetical protein